jgi:protein-disulfide isomerase
MMIALLSSTFVMSEPIRQVSATEQHQTIDALVQERFQQTATAQAVLMATQAAGVSTVSPLTATAEFVATVNSVFDRALTATALSNIPTLIPTESDNSIEFDKLPQARAEDGGFVLGNPDAPLTIVEFADFACPHCQVYLGDITRFIQDYVVTGKARFEYRVFPTAGGQTSYYTGQLLECAEEQRTGAFWSGYKLMYDYAMSGRYNNDVAQLFAADLELDLDELLTCASSATQVQADIDLADQAGITGTPAVLVRYSDGTTQFITFAGRTYSAGGPPYSVLAQLVDAVEASIPLVATNTAFFAANVEDADIVTTESGLQYEIITEGMGEKPTAADVVSVTYEVALIDGTVFDSSETPITLDLSNVIPGLTEALQLMNVGSTYKFYIPPELAFGVAGRPPTIPPNAILVFQLELISISE